MSGGMQMPGTHRSGRCTGKRSRTVEEDEEDVEDECFAERVAKRRKTYAPERKHFEEFMNNSCELYCHENILKMKELEFSADDFGIVGAICWILKIFDVKSINLVFSTLKYYKIFGYETILSFMESHMERQPSSERVQLLIRNVKLIKHVLDTDTMMHIDDPFAVAEEGVDDSDFLATCADIAQSMDTEIA